MYLATSQIEEDTPDSFFSFLQAWGLLVSKTTKDLGIG
jgi:hypothetical protein